MMRDLPSPLIEPPDDYYERDYLRERLAMEAEDAENVAQLIDDMESE